MSTESGEETARRERLSAFVDGEADGSAGTEALRAWRDDADARRDWHAWQLIGDVLRSEDLASDPRGDVRFCATVRARLAALPVVLAPAPLESPVHAGAAARRPGRWAVASAIAAGFVMVVGTFAWIRPAPTAQAPALALADTAAMTAKAASAQPPAQAPARDGPPAAFVATPAEADIRVVAEREVIRDPQLDRYLAAHKQFTGTSALGVPSTFLRSATVESSPR